MHEPKAFVVQTSISYRAWAVHYDSWGWADMNAADWQCSGAVCAEEVFIDMTCYVLTKSHGTCQIRPWTLHYLTQLSLGVKMWDM